RRAVRAALAVVARRDQVVRHGDREAVARGLGAIVLVCLDRAARLHQDRAARVSIGASDAALARVNGERRQVEGAVRNRTAGRRGRCGRHLLLVHGGYVLRKAQRVATVVANGAGRTIGHDARVERRRVVVAWTQGTATAAAIVVAAPTHAPDGRGAGA